MPSDGRQKVYPNGTLIISMAMKEADEGYYSCTAFNRREESHSGNVHIQVNPDLDYPKAQIIDINYSIQIRNANPIVYLQKTVDFGIFVRIFQCSF